MWNPNEIYDTEEYRAELRRLHRFQIRLCLLIAAIALAGFLLSRWGG